MSSTGSVEGVGLNPTIRTGLSYAHLKINRETVNLVIDAVLKRYVVIQIKL